MDCHLLERIDLSDDTERIGKSAFENSKWLRTVTKAGNVSSIGAQAFSGCQSLESIDLSDNLCEIGSRCFEHCVSLKDIYISERLEKIPERAFFRCKSLKTIKIPKSVKRIETEAFEPRVERGFRPAGPPAVRGDFPPSGFQLRHAVVDPGSEIDLEHGEVLEVYIAKNSVPETTTEEIVTTVVTIPEEELATEPAPFEEPVVITEVTTPFETEMTFEDSFPFPEFPQDFPQDFPPDIPYEENFQ